MRALAIALLCTATAAHATLPQPARVYLDRPDALDAIQQQDPERYRRIREILTLAETSKCHHAAFARALKVKYDASGGRATMLLTSFPAKRQLTFTLDGTIYMAIVTLRDSGGHVVPAIEAR